MSEEREKKKQIYEKVRDIHTGDWEEYVEALTQVFIDAGYRQIPELTVLSDIAIADELDKQFPKEKPTTIYEYRLLMIKSIRAAMEIQLRHTKRELGE